MPYNNYFPAGYQPSQYYPQYAYPQIQQNQPIPQQAQQAAQPQQMNQPMTSGIIWVQGEAGAKS